MDWYEAEVRELEGARVRHPLPPGPAVFYGSSSIKMWTTLAEDLGNRCALNLGFGGSTLQACVWFLERLVPPTRPSSLVVYAGDNDLGDGRSAQDVSRCFGELLAKVERDLKGIPFGFISIKPSPARTGLLKSIAEANETIRRTIARHPNALYIDVFTPMLGPKGQPRPELFLDDGLHLGRAGYDVWARVLRQHLHQIFTKDCAPSHTSVLNSRVRAPRVP
jgi:lysophospholipase L1-like esterase